jgi:serine/threonine-protein kinase
MLIGKVLGNRYQIIEKIGEGGMAIVYKAKCSLLNRPVAIKILKPEYSSDEDFVRRFKQEAQAAASLSHPNVVSIYDIGKEDELYYIVMEYVDGKNLKDLIKEKAPMEVDEALRVVKQILEGLEHAHQHGIVHRDVKPHNILITRNNVVKVTDFGIARAASGSTLVHTGAVLGSVYYFSPEQARGGITDAKSDIYSVGVILYEMLTGEIPFKGENPVTIALKHLREPIKSPREFNPEISEDLEAIILKALSKNADKRFASAKEMLIAIGGRKGIKSEIMKELEIEPDGPTQIFSAAEELYGDEWTKMEDEVEDKTKKQKSKRKGLMIAVIILLFLVVIGAGILFLLGGFVDKGEVKVPIVEGLAVDEAERVLAEVNLGMKIIRTSPSEEIPKDHIIFQEIEAGTPVKENSVINVIVSSGPQEVIVPQLFGETVRSAQLILSDKGLKIGRRDEAYDKEIPEGQIIFQEPKSGERVNRGTAVNIVVSKGPEPQVINMPNLIGRKKEEALQILETNKLVAGEILQDSNPDFTENVITKQEPAPNSEVVEGSPVKIWVNKNQQTIKQKDYLINVPTDGSGAQNVKLVVVDQNGSRNVYEQMHNPGDQFRVRIEWTGSSGKLQVYINNSLQEEVRL